MASPGDRATGADSPGDRATGADSPGDRATGAVFTTGVHDETMAVWYLGET